MPETCSTQGAADTMLLQVKVKQDSPEALQAAGLEMVHSSLVKLMHSAYVMDQGVPMPFTTGGRGQASACRGSAGCRAKQQSGACQRGGFDAEA